MNCLENHKRTLNNKLNLPCYPTGSSKKLVRRIVRPQQLKNPKLDLAALGTKIIGLKSTELQFSLFQAAVLLQCLCSPLSNSLRIENYM